MNTTFLITVTRHQRSNGYCYHLSPVILRVDWIKDPITEGSIISLHMTASSMATTAHGSQDQNPGSIVSKICRDNGDIWIGTDDQGLIRYRPSDGSHRHFMPVRVQNSISFHNVQAALCFDGDDLWIGTYTGGINIYNVLPLRAGSGYTAATATVALKTIGTYSIFKDRGSAMWIGTMSGIEVYDRKKMKRFTVVRRTGVTVIDICQDKKDLYGLPPGQGLYGDIIPRDEWSISASRRCIFPRRKFVNSLFIDQSDVLWAGTARGLFLYNPVNDNFEYVAVRERDDHICCIEGDNHILWLSTTNGLLRFDPDNGNCIAYSKPDGLQSDHFIASSGYKASDRIYFGSVTVNSSFAPDHHR